MGLFTNDAKSAGNSSEITIISEHLSVTGEICGPDNVYINGSFKGRIVTQGEVSIGPKGKVDAEILTKSLLVSGYLEGTIDCESMTIFPTGKVIGNLCSATLELHPGGYYFGDSRLRAPQPAPAAQADESKMARLSVVAAPPLSKESGSTSALASTPETKHDNSKNEYASRGKSNTASGVKPVAGKAEKKPRPQETAGTDQVAVEVPPETSEPRRWHSSWGRR